MARAGTLVWCLVPVLIVSVPPEPREATAMYASCNQADISYPKITDRIWKHIEGLAAQYPHLRTIVAKTQRTETLEPLWISYHYAQGVSIAPNPAYRPGKKIAPTIKQFRRQDGAELNLYFYKGRWPGQAVVSPVALGDMSVVMFLEGRETRALGSLRNDVMHIINNQAFVLECKQH